jgi:hypothetical protein
MAGLQGSGKTTNSAKLARWFKSQGRQPLMVGADLQRPAAVEQLRTLGRQIDVPVFSEPGDPVSTARRGLEEARRTRPRRPHRRHRRPSVHRRRADGAGAPDLGARPARLHLPRHRRDDRPGRGGRGRGVPRRTLAIDGVIMSKLDGDARGGAALSASRRSSAGRSPSPAPVRSSPSSSSSTPTAWPAASWAWATCSRSSSRPSRLREGPGRGSRRQADGGRVHARRLPRADAGAEEDGPARQPDGDDAGHAQGAEGRRDRRRSAQARSRRSSAA